MEKRRFHVLLGATIVLVAAAALTVLSGDRTAAPGARSEPMFPGLADRLDHLAWVRLSRGQTKIDFANIAGQWVLVEKGNYPASPAKIRRLFVEFADISLVEPMTERRELFGRLGLDDPTNGKSVLVALRDRTGNTAAELIVGTIRHDRLGGGVDGIYVRKPGVERAWLARGSLNLPSDILGWLDRGVLDISAARVASIALTDGDGAALVLRRDETGGEFAVSDLPETTRVKDDAGLSEPAGALAGLDLDDVKPAAELDFPENGVATAEFATFDGLAIKLRLINEGGVDWAAVAASGSGVAAAESEAINDKVARWVYAIPAARAKLLRTRLADVTEPAKDW